MPLAPKAVSRSAEAFLTLPEAGSSLHGREPGGLGGTCHWFYKIVLA